MAKAVVSLGDLQTMLDKYAKALKNHHGDKLDADGNVKGPANPGDIDDAVAAMESLSSALGKICQEGVLAVRLAPRK